MRAGFVAARILLPQRSPELTKLPAAVCTLRLSWRADTSDSKAAVTSSMWLRYDKEHLKTSSTTLMFLGDSSAELHRTERNSPRVSGDGEPGCLLSQRGC